jgi:hypothetical protein
VTGSVNRSVVVCILAMFSLGVYAQTTEIVVIPMQGDNLGTQTRIVSAGTTTEENSGRLEYTADLPRANLQLIAPSWANHTGISLSLPQNYTKDMLGTRSSIPISTGALLDSNDINCRNWTSSSSGDNYDYGASGFIGPWWTHTSPAEKDWRFMHDSSYCVQQ